MKLNCVGTKNNMIRHDVNCNSKRCYKDKKDFGSRKDEVAAIRNKFPTKIPLIIERFYKERGLPLLDRTKFLVPQELTMSQFQSIIRNRMQIMPNQAMYLLINNRSMLSMSQTMAQAYADHANEDGFLYITYASQEMFGGKLRVRGQLQLSAETENVIFWGSRDLPVVPN